MGRTILEIAREAAEREATAPAPVTLFGDNNRVARILRQAAHDTLREYLRSSRSEGLSEFHSQWVFSLQPGRFAYALPPDYLRMIPNTEQRGGWPMGMIGPASPVTWARWLSGAAAVTAPMGWRIKNSVLFVEPTPEKAELVIIEYISRYPVVSPIKSGDYDLTSQVPITNAPVVARDGWIEPGAVVSENPPAWWSISAQQGEVLACASPAPGAFLYDEGEGKGWDEGVWVLEPAEMLKRINPLSGVRPLPEVRRPGFTADDDRPAFDDDYLLSLGMTWRLQRALTLPYAELAAEYEAELGVRLSEDAGGARGFRLGQRGNEHGALPLGDGRWLVS